jgi:hypothetical protein
MNKPKLQISFSGGETSAYMAHLLMEKYKDTHEIVTLFANTGQEAEETLQFVDNCDKAFGLNVIWLEADVNPELGKGTQAKIVSFGLTSRNGEPFERVIAKYGIPNPMNLHCTRELKITPMQNYLRSIGWRKNTYRTAIGIRVDELDRMRDDAESNGIIYPLIEWYIDKPAINRFWRDMPFRLNLKSWEGNCKTCWKKSDRKLFTIAKERPEWFNFFAEMERQYSMCKPEGKKDCIVEPPYYFFRKHRSVADILELSKNTHFNAPSDDRDRTLSIDQLILFDLAIDELKRDLDMSSSCSESCEAY